jgi:molybdopterin molybdotransferase
MADAISFHAARAAVLAAPLPPLRTELVPLAAAAGRRLATAVASPGPWPATDRSAMDGFAVAAGPNGLPNGTTLPVVGQSLAGAPFAGPLPPGAAIQIMTGAVVPAGADAVIPVEQTTGFGTAETTLRAPVRAGQNVRRLGSEVRAGQTVLVPGRRLGPAEIGTLAVLGRTVVEVVRRPVVAIVATGDEVVPVEQQPLPHQVRESNSWALAAQVEAAGGAARCCGIAPDAPAALRAILADALATADVVLTIGGVSKGTHDLVHGTLAELGVRATFHGIQLKPGKPTFFGGRAAASGGASHVFGLPGNPASTFTVFDLLVRPLLQRRLGQTPPATLPKVRLGEAHWQPNARLQACLCRFARTAGGELVAVVPASSPSGDPFALLAGDGYVLIPPGVRVGELTSAELVGSSIGMELP